MGNFQYLSFYAVQILALCFNISHTCPYKNLESNLLSSENFYETIKFSRNFLKEAQGLSLGFHFWIQGIANLSHKVIEQFNNPYLYDEYEDGRLILTLDEKGIERFLLYHTLDDQRFFGLAFNDENSKLILSEQFKEWQFILFVFQPSAGNLIIQWESQIAAFSLNLVAESLNINLGGMKKVNKQYNLSCFRGRLTKLQIIDYFFYSGKTYTDYKNFCIIPQKFIKGFGDYSLNENSCQIGCKECNNSNQCLVEDKDLIGYYYNSVFQYIGCKLAYTEIMFQIESHYFVTCVNLEIMLPDIQVVEVNKTPFFNCKFGYFYVQKNDGYYCYQCPSQTNKTDIIECIDCLEQNMIWYLEPICKSDFITSNISSSSSFSFFQRNEDDFTVFIIDEINQLILLEGVKKFCNGEEIQNCFKLNKKHLNQTVYVECKKDYYYQEGMCELLRKNSLHIIEQDIWNLCKQGTYFLNGQCHQCPNLCERCTFNKTNGTTVCLKCIKNYAVINNQCQQCGLFCLECVVEYDKLKENQFLRCLRCVDDSKYFVSFDAFNCLENQVKNCIYAFQAVRGNISKSTLNHQFQRNFDDKKIETLCSKCMDFYIFVFELKKCLKQTTTNCIYGYAYRFLKFDKSIDKYSYDVLLDGDNEIIVKKIKCLIDEKQQEQNCSFIQNCLLCQYSIFYQQAICFQCQKGYYLDRFSQKCHKCNIPDCIECHQENKNLQDFWKLQTMPFYLEFVESSVSPFFFGFYSVQNQSEFEVVCDQCIKGFSIVDNICPKFCEFNCIKCNETSCLQCYDGLTLNKNYSCTNCMSLIPHCEVCDLRSNQEIQLFNPYFDAIFFVNIFVQSAFLCLKPTSNDLFYDSEIKRFIECEIYKEGCEKQLIIKLDLDCNLLPNFNERFINKYLMEEMFFAQYHQAKKIILKFQSIKPLICNFKEQHDVIQQISEKVFIIKNIELEIMCLHKVIWKIENQLSFQRFSKITINGLIIKVIPNILPKQILFKSLLQQEITFSNVLLFQETKQMNYLQITFQNVIFLSFVNTTFENFYIQQHDPFILVAQSNIYRVYFKNCHFINLQFQNNSLLSIIGGKDDRLVLDQVQFTDCKINNGSLVSRDMLIEDGDAELIDITFLNIILENSLQFMALQSFNSLFIQNLQINKVSLINSNFIQISPNSFIQDISIDLCTLQKKSIMLQNIENSQNQNLIFHNLSIRSNNYSESSKFILLNKFSSLNSQLYIQNLTISLNTLNSKNLKTNLMDSNSSIIFLEINKVTLKNIIIYRYPGLNELTFNAVQELKIMDSLITQDLENKIVGIHQYLECLSKTLKNNLYGISLFLSSINHVVIKNLTFQSVQSYDYPIVFFVSNSQVVNSEKQTLIFSEIHLEKSLVVQTLIQAKSSFILIESNQLIEIFIDNCTFDSNILKAYTFDTLIDSAIIFNLNAKQARVFFQTSFFVKNIAINSKAGVMYIHANSIKIQNCTFYENNVFNYEVIQPYFIWSFNEQQQIYLEQIQDLIEIQSIYGLGYFVTEEINITQSIFQVNQGTKGYLYLVILAQGKVWGDCLNFFSNTSFDLNTTGSLITIDSSQSQIMILNFHNVQVENIYSNTKGGIFYIIGGEGIVKSSFSNINVTDVYGDLGSFLYFWNAEAKNKQKLVKLENVTFIYTKFGQEKFSSKVFNYSSNYIQSEISEPNRAVIYILKASSVKFQNLNFFGLFFQSALILKETNNVQLIAISISESIFDERMVLLIPDQSYSAEIFFDNFMVRNVQFGQLKIQSYEHIQMFQKVQQQCHNGKHVPAPKFIPQLNQNPIANLQNNFESEIVASPQPKKYGVLHFQQLNELHQLKIENFQLEMIDCPFCENGIFSVNFTVIQSNLKKLTFSNIFVSNSQCGLNGCLNYFSTTKCIKNQNLSHNSEIIIQNYICQFNKAVYGTCLFLENISVLIQKCNFRANNASQSGGTIYSKQSDKNNQLIIEDTVIQENYALIGGGIFMDGQQDLNYDQLNSIISRNKAQFFANDVSATPSKLLIQIGHISNDQFEILTVQSNNTYMLQIQKLKAQTLQFGFEENFPLLPNGSPISEYSYFDWKNRTYIPMNLSLKILALTKSGVEIKNLQDTYCKIKSSIIQLSNGNEIEVLDDNYTSFREVNFDEETQNYNLDRITIYNRDDLNDVDFLELEFWCSSIIVPNYSKIYPFNLLSQHNQYFLKLQIKTFPCQMGEIRNSTFKNCQTCKSKDGFFQLKLNQTYCLLRDQVSTLEVQPAMLNLRSGYWRPYFDTNQISECKKSHSNCLGGWIEGDNSCISGHIGALCEQCDLYSIRGDGQFSRYKQFECLKCQNRTSEYWYFALNLLWTFISIGISASGNFQSVNEKVQALRLQRIGFKIHFSQNSKVLLIKMFINYLQTLNSIYTIKIDFILSLRNLIYISQSTLPNFLDCFLSQIDTIEIQYTRIIWSLILPFIYFCAFYWVYGIISFFYKMTFNMSFITTTLLYLYIYFSPILASDLIQILSYRFISGYYWISSNVAYRYDNEKHMNWMLYLGIPALFIIAFIIPSYLFKILYKNRLCLDQKSIRQLLGFLYNEYKTSAFFWEVFKIIFKITLIFLYIFYQEDEIFKSGVQILILIVYQTLSQKYQPYLTKQYNKLDQLSNQICLISVSLSQGITAGQQSGFNYFQIFFEVILIIININFIMKLVFYILKQYLDGYKQFYYQQHDKLCEILLKVIPSLSEIKFLKNFLKNYSQDQMRIQLLYSKLKLHLRKQGKIRAYQKSIHKW